MTKDSITHAGNGNIPDDKLKESQTDEDEAATLPSPPKGVSFGTLFQFADSVDAILMIIGSIGAAGNGVAQPISFIIFGKLIEQFIDFTAQLKNAYDLTSSNNSSNTTNVTLPTPINLEVEMKKFAVWFILLAACMFVLAFIQASFWSMTALRQTQKIRKKFFHSILKQDIGWFDVNESGGLLSRLAE